MLDAVVDTLYMIFKKIKAKYQGRYYCHFPR